LAKKMLEPIKVLSTGDWDKLHADGGGESGVHAGERGERGRDRFDTD